MDNKAFIGGLNFQTTEKALKDYFQDFLNDNQSVINIVIKKDYETGKSRGFAFVTFMSKELRDKALELDGHTLDGRYIGVKVAVDRRNI